MNPRLIQMLKVVAVAPDEKLLPAVEVNKYAMRCGYMIAPEACTASAVEFLKLQDANFNSTFYRDWKMVEDLSELEMRLLQALHYLSTYGTDFQAIPFVANDDPVRVMFEEFTLIGACSEKELMARITSMLTSGAALRNDTIDLLMEQLDDFYARYGWTVDLDKIPNREVLVRLCDMYGTVPTDPFGLLRYLVYRATERAIIVQNQRLFDHLEHTANVLAPIINRLTERDVQRLSSIFLRYRLVFLAIKRGLRTIVHEFDNREPWEKRPLTKDERQLREDALGAMKIINKLRRLAVKYNKPLVPGILDSITDLSHSFDDIREALENCHSPMRLVKLHSYIVDCIGYPDLRAYIIRNGKTYIKRREKETYYGPEHRGRLTMLKRMVYDRLVRIMSARSKAEDGRALTVRLPEYLELTAPASERQMMGGIPFGSSCDVVPGSYIGIYWRNEWGTRDFDLWIVDVKGNRLGWSGMHKNDDFLFSGDMTNADPEATEVMYCRGEWPDSTVRVCRYCGEEGSMFRLFMGTDDIKEMTPSYMVNPNTIKVNEDLISEQHEQTVAVISQHKVYMVDLGSGAQRVPCADDKYSLERALGYRFAMTLRLKRLLIDAGFVEYVESTDANGDMVKPDIDLSHPTKDALIALFAEEQKADE